MQESSNTTSRAKAATMLQERLGLKANGELIVPNAPEISHEDLGKSIFLDYKTKGRKSLR